MTAATLFSPAERLPVAVIGAGPVGLVAAAHLAARDLPFVVLEAGDSPGANVLQWGHVRMFSPWRYNLDEVAVGWLAATGWQPPDADHLPTGRELHDRFLQPLSETPAIAPHVRYRTRVSAVSRHGLDRQRSTRREQAPFVLRLLGAHGEEDEIEARAVLDASGTWGRPKPLGAHGLPAIGELGAAGRIVYGIPDVRGADRWRYANRVVAVVGAGDSALHLLIDLADLAAELPETRVLWVLRGPAPAYGGGAADQLPARGALGAAVRKRVEAGRIEVRPDVQISRVEAHDERVVLVGAHQRLGPIDEVIGVTGFRPDLEMLRELRLELDPTTEAPAALGPLIDPNVHSCGTVPPHGYRELAHPEPGLFILGMKSYGRAPTFLLKTGYEQVRSVVAALAGDLAAAERVSLVLPESGSCGPRLADAPAVAQASGDAR